MENSNNPEQTSGQDSGARTIDPLNAIRLLRSAGGALCSQAGLYGRLARVEWAEEKNRLMNMILVAFAGFAFLLCTLLFIGVLVLAFSWDTQYRVGSILAMMIVYAIGIAIAWHHLQSLSLLGSESFAATREEMAADLALIKSKL